MENMLFEETYYGKLPEFEECEKLLASIIQAIRADKRTVNPNKLEENKKLERLISEIFGFKKSIFYWIPLQEANAFTATVSAMIIFGETKDFIIRRPERGFYDTSKKSILTVYIYNGIADERYNLTEQEVLAVLLHEIGHNFDTNPYHMMSFWMDSILCLGIPYLQLRKSKRIEDLNNVKKEYLKDQRKNYNTIYRRQKVRDEYNDWFEDYMKNTLGSSGKIKLFGKLMCNNFLLLLSIVAGIPTQLANIGGRVGENMADDFAASYGYGKELHTGLEKIASDAFVKYKDNGKTATFLRDMNRCAAEILYTMVDVHGSNQGRAKQSIRKLEEDLETSDYPKELKNELEKEIDRLRKYYYAQLEIKPNERYKNLKRLQRFFDRFFDGEFSITKYFVRKARKKAR